jgi:hypothetical protein
LNEPIEIDDDGEDKMEEDNDGADPGSKRKLTSVVWNEFTRVAVRGVVKAKCMYCFKYLSGATSNGTRLKKAIEYMAGIDSRVAITTDMWTLCDIPI